MANLRDIINAATPGPWTAIWGADGTADVFAGSAGIAITEDVNDEGYGACSPNNAAHIAAYSPDHALLIEAFIDAFVADEEQQTTLSEVSVYTAFNALAAYRKERGLDG